MNSVTLQFIVAILIGLSASYIGSFMVLKRMSLVGDALSHVALPGIALALIWNLNPFLGAFTFLFLAVVGVWVLEKKTELPSETLVGIFFTLSLAVGLLLTPEPELLEALFGNISKVTRSDLFITIISAVIIWATISLLKQKLIIGILSKDMAKSMNISVSKINFIFLMMVALVVALGLKVAGTLLMGSLVIIPAAAAKNISTSITKYIVSSGVFGVLSSVGGIMVADKFGIPSGPAIVLASGFIFLVTLVFKK